MSYQMLMTIKHPDFLCKRQIQLNSQVQWQLSNLILEFKCTHKIGMIFDWIRFGWVFWLLKDLWHNVRHLRVIRNKSNLVLFNFSIFALLPFPTILIVELFWENLLVMANPVGSLVISKFKTPTKVRASTGFEKLRMSFKRTSEYTDLNLVFIGTSL